MGENDSPVATGDDSDIEMTWHLLVTAQLMPAMIPPSGPWPESFKTLPI